MVNAREYRSKVLSESMRDFFAYMDEELGDSSGNLTIDTWLAGSNTRHACIQASRPSARAGRTCGDPMSYSEQLRATRCDVRALLFTP